MMGKVENAGYHHFLLFPSCFQKASFPGSLKVGIVWQRDNTHEIMGQEKEKKLLVECFILLPLEMVCCKSKQKWIYKI